MTSSAVTAHSQLQGTVLWLTGPPATGKTTVAAGLLEQLHRREIITLWLDSDDLRNVFTPHPTYSPEERDVFYASVGHIAKRAAEGGVTVVISATASRRCYRDHLRQKVPRFVEIELTASPETLRSRDIKGLYKMADGGQITQLPGAGAEYERPLRPELSLDADRYSPAELVEMVMHWLESQRWSTDS
jgi:adenylylsulfate kinase